MYTKNTAIECQLSPPLPKFGPFPAKNGQAPKKIMQSTRGDRQIQMRFGNPAEALWDLICWVYKISLIHEYLPLLILRQYFASCGESVREQRFGTMQVLRVRIRRERRDRGDAYRA